jgi:hypothetical protein
MYQKKSFLKSALSSIEVIIHLPLFAYYDKNKGNNSVCTFSTKGVLENEIFLKL